MNEQELIYKIHEIFDVKDCCVIPFELEHHEYRIYSINFHFKLGIIHFNQLKQLNKIAKVLYIDHKNEGYRIYIDVLI